MLSLIIGYYVEGIIIVQIPLYISFFFHIILLITTGYCVGQPIFIIGFAASIYLSLKFGELDFSQVKPTGPFRVGYKEFTTNHLKI